MTRRYAAETSVPVDRTKSEIERTITRYGATAFMTGWENQKAMLSFTFDGRMVRFIIEGSEGKTQKRRDQSGRQRWRALLLLIKAKLEYVDSGIHQFEEEFLGNIVTDNGETVAERIIPQLELGTANGPLLLPPGKVN